MGDGKHCPSCGKDIGVWPVFSAGFPSWIWCPHCKSRLRYRDAANIAAVLVAIALLVVVSALIFFPSLTNRGRLVILLIPWVPVELVMTWFLRNRRELELVKRSRNRS